MREIYLGTIKEDLLSYLPGIKAPTIIIWGEKDNITPFKDSYFIKEKISGSKLKTFPGVGHRLRKEVPEKLAQIILEEL